MRNGDPVRGGAAPLIDTDVLIAGGGPVGLALAIELGRRGIAAILVDPIEPQSTDDLAAMRTIPAPRAKLTNIRSMEHARRWGIAQRLRDIAPDYPRNVLFVTSLAGYTLAKIQSAFGYDGGDRDLFAEGPLQCRSSWSRASCVMRRRRSGRSTCGTAHAWTPWCKTTMRCAPRVVGRARKRRR